MLIVKLVILCVLFWEICYINTGSDDNNIMLILSAMITWRNGILKIGVSNTGQRARRFRRRADEL